MYSLGVKKNFIEFLQTKIEPSIEFYGFNRNIMMKDIRFDKKDKLSQIFMEVQYDLDELYEVKEAEKNTTIEQNRVFLKKPPDSNALNSFLVEDLPEGSFGMQVGIDGSVQISINSNNKFVTIIHHHGDFESLYSYASYKKDKKTPPDSKTDNRKVSEIHRQYLYLRPKNVDGPNATLIENDSKAIIDDVKFIKDYQELIGFCFHWLGKPLPNKFKFENDLFKVLVKKDPVEIQFNSTPMTFTLEQIIVKYFEYINSVLMVFTGDKEKERSAILACPKHYTMTQKKVLQRCVEKAKIKILREIDSLTQLFNRIQQIVNLNPLGTGFDKLVPRFRRILDSEIKDDKTCGIEIDLDGQLNYILYEDNELKRLRNHIADLKNLTSKFHLNIINEFKTIISFAFKFLGIPGTTVEENEFIEIATQNPLTIRLKNTLEEYSLDYIVFKYLQCASNILVYGTNGRLNKLIIAYPMEYNSDQKSELIKSFGKIGFQFIKDVDVIEQYFNKIQNILKPVYIPEEIATYRNRVILDEQYISDTFSIQQNSKGRCRITVFKEDKFLIIANHLGDVESSKVKITGSLELIKNFRLFIETCVKLLAGVEVEKPDELYGFDIIQNTNPIKVKLKETSIEYTVNDVLSLYFSFLIASITELEPDKFKNIIYAYPFEFNKAYMEELKTLIEKTGLILAKEVDGLEQIFNRYENMMKEEVAAFTPQESCSIIYKELLEEENMWGYEMCLKGSARVGLLQEGKFNTLNMHIANLNQIIKSSKLFSEMEFLKDLRSIINYSLAIITNTSKVEILKTFKAFEVSSNDPNFVKYKNIAVEYSINDVLEYFFKILHKTILKVSNRESNMVQKIILSVPLEYSCSDTVVLNKFFENAGFIVVKFIDQLDQHINKVLNQISPPYKIETLLLNEQLKYPTIRSVLDKELVTNNAFSMEFYPDLRIGIGLIENNKHYTLINHVGDLISYPLNLNETENQLAITKYESLIEYCFKKYSEPLSKFAKKNFFFSLAKVNKSNICFKDSTVEFPIATILQRHIELIVDSLQTCFGIKFKKVIVAGRVQYNQMNLKALTDLIESSGLVLVKVENGLDQRFNIVLNEISPPYKCETNKLSDTQKYLGIRSIPDEDLRLRDWISMEHFKPSRLAISFMEENVHYTVVNHFGDLSVYNHYKTDDLFEEALKVLKELIDLSLNTLINTNLVNNEINYTQFKITSTDPIKVTFPYSKEEFTIEDIFNRLISCIHNAVTSSSENKGKTLIAGIPIGHGKMNVKMLEETLKEKNIELKMNLNELQRLFNRAQHQLTQLANKQEEIKPNIKTILSSDLNNKGMFALAVNAFCEFSINGFRNGKNQTIKYHFGNIEELLRTEEFEDKRSVELLGRLIQYAYRITFGFHYENIIEENELFEISTDDPKLIKFKTSKDVFDINIILDQFFIHLKETITKFIGSEAKEYIGDILPKEYDDDKKSMLEGFLESSGIKLLKYEKSELDQIINTIMNLTPNYEEQEDMNYNELNDHSLKTFDTISYDDNNSFVVEMKENGDVKVGLIKDNKYVILPYNMGLPKTTLRYKYCTNSQEEKTALGFKTLLNYSFGTLGKTGSEIDPIQSDFFQIIPTIYSEIQFNLTDSEEEYYIEDLIAFYFEWISKWIYIKTGVKSKSMILVSPPQFGLFQRTDLMKCIGKTSLNVKRLLTIPVAESVAISSIEDKNERGKHILIDWNSGTINVTLSEKTPNSPLKVLMSFQGSDLKPLKTHFDKSIDTERGGAKKSIFDSIEFKELTDAYIKESIDLYKAILIDHGITENDINRVDFFLQSDNVLTENVADDFKKFLSEAEMRTGNFYCQDKLDYLEALTKLVNSTTSKNIVKTSLCFNFGIKTFLGRFDILLKRGTELPFKVVKEYCTVRDYQTKTILNIYRGERPFVRFCEKVGVLAVQNLPKRKAGQVNIKVGFAVDENETLQIEAKHLSRDENGNLVESELYEMHIDRIATESKEAGTEGTMILESQKFKDDDANTSDSTDRINNLIDSIRLISSKLPNQILIQDSINQIIDDINKNEDKLDDLGLQDIITKLLAIEALASQPSDEISVPCGPSKSESTLTL